MIIYNITINVDQSIHEEWLTWIKDHIPQVLATGKFTEAKLTKVLVEEEMGGTTYSVQYRATSRGTLDAYYREDAEKLKQVSFIKFGDKALAFRTELEIIDEYKVTF
jgi:Domain of unknown function (DUF4286)